jgi:hypothetical protein
MAGFPVLKGEQLMISLKIFSPLRNGFAIIHFVEFFSTPKQHAEKRDESCKYKNHKSGGCLTKFIRKSKL